MQVYSYCKEAGYFPNKYNEAIKQHVHMINEATIPSSGVLEIKDVPTRLLFYAAEISEDEWKTSSYEMTTLEALCDWLILKTIFRNEIPNYKAQLSCIAGVCKTEVEYIL